MSPQNTLSRLGACCAAMLLMIGVATTANAQDILCQLWTGQADPLSTQSAVTVPFLIEIEAVETNQSGNRLRRGTGLTEIEFVEVGGVGEGGMLVEVNANLKRLTNDPGITCANDATLRGPGFIQVFGDDLIIRANSQLTGRLRSGTVIKGPVGEDEINSIHRVRANLRYTTQGSRNNETPRYDRGTARTRDIYEIVEGDPPGNGEDLLLICTCLGAVNGEPMNGDR